MAERDPAEARLFCTVRDCFRTVSCVPRNAEWAGCGAWCVAAGNEVRSQEEEKRNGLQGIFH